MLRRSPIALCTLCLLLWTAPAGWARTPAPVPIPSAKTVSAPTFAPVPATSPSVCPRPHSGSVIEDPEDLRSQNGVLKLDLTVRNETLPDGRTRYCYLLPDGSQSPTLRVKPGDLLVLNLKNELTGAVQPHEAHHPGAKASSDPCTSGVMSPTSANLHFHGLTVPPVCHQDEVLKTSIQPGDPPFEYHFRIPANEPPGLYWYHPHIHGFSSMQVQGGASGALIVEGLERAAPEVAGLPERVLVIRDQDLLNPTATSPSGLGSPAIPDRDGDAVNTGTGGGKPAKDLSVNFVPVPYPDYPLATVQMKPGEKQLWRVLNASSLTYLDLTMLFKRGSKYRPEWVGLVAIDGVPVDANGSPSPAVRRRNSIVLSPGSRVEFILTGPPAGVPAMLITRSVNTGESGENDPDRALVSIVASRDAPEPKATVSTSSEPLPAPTQPWLGNVTPTRTRKLFFSEEPVDPRDPNGPTRFYLTVDGETPKVFDPASTEPNIVAHQGDVEDWIIENRSTELHAFHIHQIHFQVIEWAGLTVNEPFLRDTINVPFYNLSMPHYPTVRLRMDFRDPNTIGTFVYHCHLLEHEDNGMMGLIRVDPAVRNPARALPH